jgi:hypothetical protein
MISLKASVAHNLEPAAQLAIEHVFISGFVDLQVDLNGGIYS